MRRCVVVDMIGKQVCFDFLNKSGSFLDHMNVKLLVKIITMITIMMIIIIGRGKGR